MSRKSNLRQTSGIACTLSLLLLLSTARAAAVENHVVVPVIQPKVSAVIVKPNVPHIATTTGRTIGSQSNGAGAGKEPFNTFSSTKNVGTASPSLFKDATTGKTIGVKTETVGAGVTTVSGAGSGGTQTSNNKKINSHRGEHQ